MGKNGITMIFVAMLSRFVVPIKNNKLGNTPSVAPIVGRMYDDRMFCIQRGNVAGLSFQSCVRISQIIALKLNTNPISYARKYGLYTSIVT